MASFSDIVKYQRSQGAGVMGSLATAIGQSTLQKIDPRNYLFSRTGMTTSLFPFLKGYQAKTSQAKNVAPKLQPIVTQAFDKETVSRIQRIDISSRINAKNSMVLPMMARDMNLMRQNIQKMTKQSTGSSVRKADMFFKRAPERESAFKSVEKKEGGSLIGGLLGGIGSAAGGILSIGGSLIGGIASMIGGIGGAIFKTIGIGLSLLGPIGLILAAGAGFLIYQLSKNINFDELKNSFKGIFGTKEGEPSFVERVTNTIKEALGYDQKSNLAGEIAKSLDETFKTSFFKDALLTIVTSYDKFLIYSEAFFEKGKLVFEDLLSQVEQMAAGVLGAMLGFSMGKQLPNMIPLPGEKGSGPAGKTPRDARGRFTKRATSSMLQKAGNIVGMGARLAGRGLLGFLGPVGLALAGGTAAYELWGLIGGDFSEEDFMEELDYLLFNKSITPEQYDAILKAKPLYEQMSKNEEEIRNQLKLLRQTETSGQTPADTNLETSTSIDRTTQAQQIQSQLEKLKKERENLENKVGSLESLLPAGTGKALTGQEGRYKMGSAAIDARTASRLGSAEEEAKNRLGFTNSTTPTKVSGNKEEFYKNVYAAVFKSATDQGVENPDVIARLGATQASLETGWGSAVVGNNFFGIKAKRGEQGVTAATKENIDGKEVPITATFRKYNSLQESADDYVKFLKENSRYSEVLKAKTVEQAIELQGKTGYATDPTYGNKLSSIYSGTRNLELPKNLAAAPSQDATQKTGLLDSLINVTQKTFESDITEAMSQIAVLSAMTGQSFGEIGDKITAAFQALIPAMERQSVSYGLQVASAQNSNEIEDYRRPMGA